MVDDVNCHGASPLTGRSPGTADAGTVGLHPSAEITMRLLGIGERLRQRLARSAADLGFTPQQAILIDRLTTPRTMGQLADDLACDKSNVTGLIARLEARGLVSREPDANDRRVRWLTLTASGRAARECLMSGLVEQSEAMLAGVEDREREALLATLRTIAMGIAGDSPGGQAPPDRATTLSPSEMDDGRVADPVGGCAGVPTPITIGAGVA